MPDSRTDLLRTLFKSWWVRAGAGTAFILTCINGYAGVQDQFESMPKLQALVAIPHLGFLPWWGWMLVWLFALQCLFVYTLFEYVRVKVAAKVEAVAATSLETKAAANRARVNAPQAAAVPKAQLGPWEHVDRFKVSEAANLWANFLPGGSYIYDKATRPAVVAAERLITSELAGALDTSEIPSYKSVGDYEHAYVSRADLEGLAERKGIRPFFLYPKG
jgi:hypothetical protein